MKNCERDDVRAFIIGEMWDDLRRLGFTGFLKDLDDWLNAEDAVEMKYYWHLKGFGDYGYLNFNRRNWRIAVETNICNDDFKTTFTEREYRELSERFGFDFNTFEREGID